MDHDDLNRYPGTLKFHSVKGSPRRRPLLGDSDLFAEVSMPLSSIDSNGILSTAMGNKHYPVMSGNQVRDYYERLIDEGKLRVVGDCVLRKDNDPDWPMMDVLGCNGRGPITDEVYCPYCGNKIKR